MRVSAALRRKIESEVNRTSIYQVAQRCGIDYKIVHRFVSGERADLRLSTVDAICTALGLELRVRKK